MGTEAPVRLRDVTKRYGRRVALADATIDFASGITALLGPNGAGKSTLLRLLATLATPDEGELWLLGRSPRDPGQLTEIRRRLGYLPEEPGFHEQFTVFDFVDYLAILKEHLDRRARHAEVERVLELVGLDDRAGARMRTLSGGMRRRVAVAQALLGDPPLLVLDEPTGALDPEQRAQLRALLSRTSDHQAVVLATHQTDDVAALAHRVAVLFDGRIRFHGTPEQLRALARGCVWHAPQPDPRAAASWRIPDGRYRHVGHSPPAEARLVEPTIEDGYLIARHATAEASAP